VRWTPKRKAAVVAAIERGIISTTEARELHDLSEEELVAWMRDYAALGQAGLRLTNRPPARKRDGGPHTADRVVLLPACRVEWCDDDGDCQVVIFVGPRRAPASSPIRRAAIRNIRGDQAGALSSLRSGRKSLRLAGQVSGRRPPAEPGEATMARSSMPSSLNANSELIRPKSRCHLRAPFACGRPMSVSSGRSVEVYIGRGAA
jgi:hypothetical protein